MTIDAGKTSVIATYPISRDDSLVSGDLTATVTGGERAYRPAAAPGNAATVAVVVASPPLTAAWAEDAWTADEGERVTVTATLSTAAGVPQPRKRYVIAVYTESDSATAGDDYTSVSKNLTVEPGDWTADGAVFTATVSLPVETPDDSVLEGDERFYVLLSGALLNLSPGLECPDELRDVGGGTNCATVVTIADNETLSVTGVTVSSTPGAGETYLAGEAIEFTATFTASVTVGALGVKGQVLDGTGPSGMRVNLKSDAMWVGTKSARSADMVGTQGDVMRLRLVAQGERDFVLAEQGTLTPSAELGLRHDGGDAETGVGVEFGAGLRYMVGSFTIEAQARTLVAHEASGYEEWGASAAVRLTPSASGRGLSLSIAPTWGRTGSASEWLWSARDAGEFEGGGGGGFEADGRIDVQMGYGVALPHNRGLLTPYGALTLGSEGGRTMRGGARWTVDSDLAVTLDATRNESAGAEAENEVRVRAALRF